MSAITRYWGMHLTREAYQPHEVALRRIARDIPWMPPAATFPCGSILPDYGSWEGVPHHNVPCPCGNPNHMFLEWHIFQELTPPI